MNYKTIRYPGHCAQMRLLMNDLKLNHDRATLKRVLENAVPQTLQDVVIVYVAVTGTQDGELREENYVNKVYPQVIAGRLWSAIQVTTASGITAVVDLVLPNPEKHRGFIAQEQFRLPDILKNRFGRYYAPGGTKDVSSEVGRHRQGRAVSASCEEPCDERRGCEGDPVAARPAGRESGHLVRNAGLVEGHARRAHRRAQSVDRRCSSRRCAARRPRITRT